MTILSKADGVINKFFWITSLFYSIYPQKYLLAPRKFLDTTGYLVYNFYS